MTNDHSELDAPGHAGAVAHHPTDDHGDDHGHDDRGHVDHGHDDRGHVEEPLGPIDVAAWGAGVLGIAIGLAVAFCFVLATA